MQKIRTRLVQGGIKREGVLLIFWGPEIFSLTSQKSMDVSAQRHLFTCSILSPPSVRYISCILPLHQLFC
jgi:hypothetical protein